ncbi:MAG: T9SS C-terminal target domain-containing protein [Bacteroidetes bacterium]|nr:MAG: T9SS C-terminal target domain-containing protein [Bacteroidota bacterium]
MKNRIFTLLAFMLVAGFSFGQYTFSDDFESYAPGDFLGVVSPTWTTWSNNVGTTEDVQVTDADAFSGNNSIRFQSFSTSGGPQDVVLPFGAKYETGDFVFSMMMKVQGGTGAYFNFQGEQTIGQTWALEWLFLADGSYTLRSNGVDYIIGNDYPHDAWMEVKVVGDLTNNHWEAFIDGTSIGTFTNGINSVASLDIFPVEGITGQSTFFVDDVNFSHEPAMLNDLDASLTAINAPMMSLAGTQVTVGGTVRNIGNNPITSMDVTWSNGVDDATMSLTGLNIPTWGEYTFEHDTPLTLEPGDNPLILTVTNVNGGVDEDDTNNALTTTISGVTPAPNRKVVIEEGTGTWCGWCPRGTVFIETMLERYPDHFIPIAVHNGDPMVNAEYNASLGITAFPSMSNERTETFGFGAVSDVENRFLTRVQMMPPASVSSSVAYDPATGSATFFTEATAMQTVSGNYRLAIVLTEDNVTGTGSGYAQVNYYSGGAQGPMGGYEALPNPVPAAQMVYDHVGRELVGGFNGVAGSLPADMTMGETYYYTFDPVTLDPAWDVNEMHIVTLVLNPQGQIVNANIQRFTDALTGTKEVFANHLAKVSPNPFSDVVNVTLNLETKANVEMTVFNAIGQVVASRNYGELSGELVLPFNGAGFAEGIYYIHLKLDNQLITKKVVLSR